jgi:hypothetical protein
MNGRFAPEAALPQPRIMRIAPVFVSIKFEFFSNREINDFKKTKTKTSPTAWVYKRIFDCESTFEFSNL